MEFGSGLSFQQFGNLQFDMLFHDFVLHMFVILPLGLNLLDGFFFDAKLLNQKICVLSNRKVWEIFGSCDT